jgi:hypothetical protein
MGEQGAKRVASPWGASDCSGNPAGLPQAGRGIGAESAVLCMAKKAQKKFFYSMHFHI